MVLRRAVDQLFVVPYASCVRVFIPRTIKIGQ